MLEGAIDLYPEGAMAYYYLGDLYYDKLQYERAVRLWEDAAARRPDFPTVHRNLALAYYNKQGEPEKARAEMEKAFALDESDARVFLELDQLYKKLEVDFETRLKNYEEHIRLTRMRDDVMIEYVTLCNLLGMHEKAYETIMSHIFGPWEGAEGKITAQYKTALLEMAKKRLGEEKYTEAEELLTRCLSYPQNLGEGRLEGTKDNNIYCYLGVVKKHLGKTEEALDCFHLAELGENEPAGVMYYYDQPADMILYKGLAKQELGKSREAHACFNKLMDYGEQHLGDEMRIDYFAVSLPDFLIFDDDLNRKNKAHCYYLMGLSCLGMGENEKAAEKFEKALGYDYNHQNCRTYLEMARR